MRGSRRVAVCLALLGAQIAAGVTSVAAASPHRRAGRTSQGQRVRLNAGLFTNVTVRLRAGCTDRRSRMFSVDLGGPQVPRGGLPGKARGLFFAQRIGPPAAAYIEHGSFSAHYGSRRVIGSLRAIRDLGDGVTCRTGRVTFRVKR